MWTLKKKLTDKLIFKLSKGEEKIVAGIKENKYIPLEILYRETTAEMIEVGENELKITFPAHIGGNRYVQDITIKYKCKSELNVLNWKPLDIQKEMNFQHSKYELNTLKFYAHIPGAKYVLLNIYIQNCGYIAYVSDGKKFYNIGNSYASNGFQGSIWLPATGNYYICLGKPELNAIHSNVGFIGASYSKDYFGGSFKVLFTAYV